MRLDTPKQISRGAWSFRYFCPKALKMKTAAAKTKNAAKAKWNAIKILQGQTPESPTASLTPLSAILEMYEQDRQNDIRDGSLRQATFDGYMQHVSRLKPLGAEEIKQVGDKFIFRYYKKSIGRFTSYSAASLAEAELMHKRIDAKALADDPLYQEKQRVLAAPIKDLNWEFIQRVLRNIDRSQKTRERHFVTYTNIITWAIKKGYLLKTQSDLIDPARPVKGAKKQIEIPSEESVKKLIDNSDDFWKAFWMVSATTGARLGELTALKWHNVHLNGARIYIDSSTQRSGEITAPKTQNSYRELPIGPKIVNLLSQFERKGDLVWPCPEFGAPYRRVYNRPTKRDDAGKFSCTGEVTKMTRVIEPRRLTEPNEERPMNSDDVFRVGLQPVLRDHNISWKGRIHSLRHFAASRMIELNWNIKKIQTRMGHASAQTTLDIYGHLMDRQTFHEEAEQLSDGLF